jgi:hypothetical protein
MEGLSPVTHECIAEAASQNSLPPSIVYSLLAVEGGRVGQAVRNTNGTYDMGPMQINTIWLSDLAARYGISAAAIQDLLIKDGCFNIGVGTWILKNEILRTGEFWSGVASYHSRTPERGRGYVLKVASKAMELYGRGIFPGLPNLSEPPVEPQITHQARSGSGARFSVPLPNGQVILLSQDELADFSARLAREAANNTLNASTERPPP